MAEYDELAEKFCEAIRYMGQHEDALWNFECYLSHHFPAWMKEFANTPERLIWELNLFAHMFDAEAETA